MDRNDEILIENDLFTFVTTLYDAYLEDAKEAIKQEIKDYCEKNNLKEKEVVEKLNQLMKKRSQEFPRKNLLKWFSEYDEPER